MYANSFKTGMKGVTGDLNNPRKSMFLDRKTMGYRYHTDIEIWEREK